MLFTLRSLIFIHPHSEDVCNWLFSEYYSFHLATTITVSSFMRHIYEKQRNVTTATSKILCIQHSILHSGGRMPNHISKLENQNLWRTKHELGKMAETLTPFQQD